MEPKISAFWRWLKRAIPQPEPLHWCHTTDAFALRSMMRAGQINTVRCNVFVEEDLIYLFYGRPAYRAKEWDQLRLSSKAPIVIVFSGDVEKSGKRIFPFDSGAFGERYLEFKHPEMSLGDFVLPCGEAAAQRQVAEFFQTNENYFNLKAEKPARAHDGEFEVETVTQILTDPSARSADDRRLAIELQIDNPIPLSSPHVRSLIVPDVLSDAPWFIQWRQSHPEVPVNTYTFAPLRSAGHYQDTLERECRNLGRHSDRGGSDA